MAVSVPLAFITSYLYIFACQAACLVRVPTEVVKTRTQTSTYGNLGKSSFAVAKQVLLNDGFKGFYRGFGITVMREVSEIFRPSSLRCD